MRPACLGKEIGRKGFVLGFGFLQAQNIDITCIQKLLYQITPQTHRIDIPCRYFHITILT